MLYTSFIYTVVYVLVKLKTCFLTKKTFRNNIKSHAWVKVREHFFMGASMLVGKHGAFVTF